MGTVASLTPIYKKLEMRPFMQSLGTDEWETLAHTHLRKDMVMMAPFSTLNFFRNSLLNGGVPMPLSRTTINIFSDPLPQTNTTLVMSAV